MQVQNPEVTDIIRRSTRLTLAEAPPSNLASDIRAVIDVTPRFHKLITTTSAESTTSGTITVMTASSSRQTFITGFCISYVKNSTCDISSGSMLFSCVQNGATIRLARVAILTLRDAQDNFIVTFDRPLLVDKGTTVTLTGTFTVGAMSRCVTLYYYEQDSY